jgi:hypothetical protein
MTFKRKLRVACDCRRAVCCLQGGKITTEGTEKCGGGNAERKTGSLAESRILPVRHDPSAASQHKALALRSGLTRVWRDGEIR